MDAFTYSNLANAAKSKVLADFVSGVKAEYDSKYLNAPPRKLIYNDFKRIYIDGNRVDWQHPTHELVNELSCLRVLALTDDKYIEPLEQAIFELCNQFTWAWPAHSYDADGKFDYTFIDLRVAEYSCMLAETVHVFGDKLSADIRDRIKYSIKTKLIDNYESRTFWWEEEVNNWLAVCACGIGISYLYLFPERLDKVKDRLISTFERFVSEIPDDGAYTEGIGYLDFAFSNFAMFCKTYETVVGQLPEIVNSPKLKSAVAFLNNCSFDGGLLIPFSDGWHEGATRNMGAVCAIKLLFPEIILPEERLLNKSCSILTYSLIASAAEYGIEYADSVQKGTKYYSSSQWLISKREKYNFIAKCGNNSEMHNHCDVGAFEINVNGAKIIADPGAAVYSYKYFNDLTDTGRYSKETLLASSWGHSVPIVNGKAQYGYGAWTVKQPYAGKVLEAGDNVFKIDIAGVYPEGEVDSLIVEYQLFDDKVKVAYSAKGLKTGITFRFVSFVQPTVDDGVVSLGTAKLASVSGLKPIVDCPEYENKKSTVYTVDFEVKSSGDVSETFEIIL